jgi:GLTT repeat (6 copies)
MKILYVLPLLAASAFHVVPQANAATLDNGRNINGVELNGRNINGRNLNGGSLNGRNVNGLATNGLSTNGLSTNGVDREEAIGHATSVILKDGERVSRQ